MNKLRRLWATLNSSLWFLPAVVVACGVALALLLVEVDRFIGGERLAGYPRLFGVEPSGSRDMLATVAGSMISVAGIVFSLTIVALSLASTQYTPRILRNFMRDRVNQTVLGVFLGIFAYCIIVLRTIRGGDDDGVFVPSLAVITGVVLALVGIGFLIFYIHHIATSIQASTIISTIAAETVETIDELFPARIGADAGGEPEARSDAVERFAWHTIPAPATGYIQSVDANDLLRLTSGRDLVVRMERGVGEFVVRGAPLASVAAAAASGADARPPADLPGVSRRIADIYSIGSYRTVDQDIAFGIRQIVDIVMKALSPGINDTTTAVIAIDYLTAILSHLAVREFPTARRYADGELRVIARRPSFDDLLDLAFNQVRQNARDNVAVHLRALHALEHVARTLLDPDTELTNAERRTRLDQVIRHEHAIAAEARRNVSAPDDLAQIEEHISKVERDLASRDSAVRDRAAPQLDRQEARL